MFLHNTEEMHNTVTFCGSAVILAFHVFLCSFPSGPGGEGDVAA